MASKIVYNAKLRNTAICGATETILLHERIVKKFCNPILKKLDDQNCKIYGDKIVRKYFKGKVYPAKEKDWSTEYLTAAVSVKVVKSNVAYNVGFHSAPHQHDGEYHWHIHIWPNLVTQAGFERGTGVMINVVPPESAASALRESLQYFL